MSSPMVVPILVGETLVVPDHLQKIHRGEIRLSPMVYRGFVRGEMSPPTAISIVSLSGGTHPAMDAVSVQSLVSVFSPPRSLIAVGSAPRAPRSLLYKSRSALYFGNLCGMFR